MKSWKLVSGILCIVLCVIVLFQSCAAGLANALEENGDSGGTAGLLVALLLLAGGVTSIATRKQPGKGGQCGAGDSLWPGCGPGFQQCRRVSGLNGLGGLVRNQRRDGGNRPG